jgi:hypothetical protein
MTESEALHILKCSSVDEVDDAFEELLFNFKGKILQVIPPLKILEATIKKIERINEAYNLIAPSLPIQNKISSHINDNLTLIDFLKGYQIKLAEIKLQLSSSENGELFLVSIRLLMDLQKQLYIKLTNCLGGEIVDLTKFEIKLSENIDVFKIQKDLKELQLEDNKISEYIRKQINELDSKDMSYLVKSVLNSAKQIVFNGIRREI